MHMDKLAGTEHVGRIEKERRHPERPGPHIHLAVDGVEPPGLGIERSVT